MTSSYSPLLLLHSERARELPDVIERDGVYFFTPLAKFRLPKGLSELSDTQFKILASYAHTDLISLQNEELSKEELPEVLKLLAYTENYDRLDALLYNLILASADENSAVQLFASIQEVYSTRQSERKLSSSLEELQGHLIALMFTNIRTIDPVDFRKAMYILSQSSIDSRTVSTKEPKRNVGESTLMEDFVQMKTSVTPETDNVVTVQVSATPNPKWPELYVHKAILQLAGGFFNPTILSQPVINLFQAVVGEETEAAAQEDDTLSEFLTQFVNDYLHHGTIRLDKSNAMHAYSCWQIILMNGSIHYEFASQVRSVLCPSDFGEAMSLYACLKDSEETDTVSAEVSNNCKEFVLTHLLQERQRDPLIQAVDLFHSKVKSIQAAEETKKELKEIFLERDETCEVVIDTDGGGCRNSRPFLLQGNIWILEQHRFGLAIRRLSCLPFEVDVDVQVQYDNDVICAVSQVIRAGTEAYFSAPQRRPPSTPDPKVTVRIKRLHCYNDRKWKKQQYTFDLGASYGQAKLFGSTWELHSRNQFSLIKSHSYGHPHGTYHVYCETISNGEVISAVLFPNIKVTQECIYLNLGSKGLLLRKDTERCRVVMFKEEYNVTLRIIILVAVIALVIKLLR